MFKKIILNIRFVFLLWIFSGCNSNNFNVYNNLGGLRVLSVVATDGPNSEASPGDTVQLTPYVSDINDNGPITVSAIACVDPGIDFGAAITCAADPNTQTLTTSNWTSPMTGFLPAISVQVPANLLTNQAPNDQYNGVNYLVLITMTPPGGAPLVTLRRIIVSLPNKPVKAQNPVIASITNNGAPLAAGQISPNELTTLIATSTPGSTQSFQYYDDTGTLQTGVETMTYTWFISDGSLQYTRTAEGGTNQYTGPPSYPTTRQSFIVTVLRNGRGGEAVVETVIH